MNIIECGRSMSSQFTWNFDNYDENILIVVMIMMMIIIILMIMMIILMMTMIRRGTDIGAGRCKGRADSPGGKSHNLPFKISHHIFVAYFCIIEISHW